MVIDVKNLNKLDLAEIAVGAGVLAMPLALTEEVWDLATELPTVNAVIIVIASCVILDAFIYLVQGGAERFGGTHAAHLKRVAVTYGITLLVCAGLLALVTKLPLLTDPAVAMKRMVLVALPACFSATVVDHLR